MDHLAGAVENLSNPELLFLFGTLALICLMVAAVFWAMAYMATHHKGGDQP